MKVLGGNFSKAQPARVKKTFWGRNPRAVSLYKNIFSLAEEIPFNQIEDMQIVNQGGHKDGWQAAAAGLAGGLVLGGVGALAGVLAGGNIKKITVAVHFKDGRGVILECSPDEYSALHSGFHFSNRSEGSGRSGQAG